VRDTVVALTVIVALPIDATPQPGLREELILDLPLVFQLDLGLEDVDFAPKPRRYLGSQHLFPRHSRSLSQ